MARWITNKDRSEVALKIATQLPTHISSVAGVSRGGIPIAVQIAELIHAHAYSINKDGELVDLSYGFRLRHKRMEEDGAVLIVDDTIANGTTFKRLKEGLKFKSFGSRKVYLAAGYVPANMLGTIDFVGDIAELPHYLEWNFFNSVHVQHAAFDFDGVLCENCPREMDDDGEQYLKFLRTARPLYLVRRRSIPLIVTGRLEKYRQQTLAWLSRYGISVDKLVMGPWKDINERRRNWSAKELKGETFKKSHLKIFVESCPRQSKEIYSVSGRTVICPTTSTVYSSDDCDTEQAIADIDSTTYR